MTARRNEQRDIFNRDEGRQKFLALAPELPERFRVEIEACGRGPRSDPVPPTPEGGS